MADFGMKDTHAEADGRRACGEAEADGRRARIERAGAALLAMQRHSWEQGTALLAFCELGDMDTVVRLSMESVYRISEDGRPAAIGVADGSVDPCSVGGPLLAAVEYTKPGAPGAYPGGHEALVEGAGALRRWALKRAPRNAAGVVYHLTTGTEFWSDSINMMPSYLAAAGEPELAVRHLDAYWEGLYDKEAGLLCHIWDDGKRVMSDPAHWGVGNGWALMGLVRVLPYLAGDPAFAETALRYRARVTALVDRIWSLRGADGRFHNVLDDPSSFEEAGIASMTAYAVYRSVGQGWMDPSYLEKADVMRAYVEGKQDAFGFIRDVCGAPTFDRPGIAPEQQAAFMLMENASLCADGVVRG